ncbi:MAG: hypothetical protein AAFP19_20600, partial [Bacteroidota bacterium]
MNPSILSLLLFLVLANFHCAFGQDRKLPLHEVKFSDEIEEALLNKQLSESSAAYFYTYIGKYRQALNQYELKLDWGLDSLAREDSLRFLDYQLIDPFVYLEEKTKTEQMVIISEAHHKPQHRVFTRKLLKTLYQNGFRYLGLETLMPSYGDTTKFLMDTQLHQRKYPLNSPITGFYTREPQMGNLVREALDLGFELFAYESTTKDIDRDLQQALNIERFLANRPKAKILIHCGWYHAIESDYPKRKKDHYLAYHLKERMGIDPLTIYQDALSEKTTIKASPYYPLVKGARMGLLVNKEGQVFNGNGTSKHFDIFLYHPPNKYLRNRAHWLFEIEENQLVEVKKQGIEKDQYPILVKAILTNEEAAAVPLDQIELESEEDQTALVLPRGNYQIILTTKNTKIDSYS